MATYSNRTVLSIAAVVGALVIGAIAGFALDPEAAEVPPVSPTAPSGPGPTDQTDGAPVGYARTEDGAVAAATNFGLISTNDAVWSRRAFQDAMESLAAPSWKSEAREQAADGYDFITNRYGPDADVSGAALRYKVVAFSPTRAAVKLWIVTVISGSQRRTVDEVWGTATVRLAWVDGDWRVEGTENETGPAPVDLPTTVPPESARSAMEELKEFTGAPLP